MCCCWARKTEQLLWTTGQWFLKRLKIKLPHDPGIPPLGTDPDDEETGSQRGVCTSTLKQQVYSSQGVEATQLRTGRCVYKPNVHAHSPALFCLGEKEILSRATARTDLEAPRERSQPQNNKRRMTLLLETPHRQQTGLCQGRGGLGSRGSQATEVRSGWTRTSWTCWWSYMWTVYALSRLRWLTVLRNFSIIKTNGKQFTGLRIPALCFPTSLSPKPPCPKH